MSAIAPPLGGGRLFHLSVLSPHAFVVGKHLRPVDGPVGHEHPQLRAADLADEAVDEEPQVDLPVDGRVAGGAQHPGIAEVVVRVLSAAYVSASGVG